VLDVRNAHVLAPMFAVEGLAAYPTISRSLKKKRIS
jgi:hypothetical protein